MTVLEIQLIIATLVLMVAGRGLAQLITEGYIVTFSDTLLIFIATGSFLGFPMPVVIALVLMVLATLMVRRTALGLLIEAVGVNRSAARFAGLSANALLLIRLHLRGLLCRHRRADCRRRHPGGRCEQRGLVAGA